MLDAARAADQPMPEAMTIASATSDGVPSARLVVLRGLRPGLAFFTDCHQKVEPPGGQAPHLAEPGSSSPAACSSSPGTGSPRPDGRPCRK